MKKLIYRLTYVNLIISVILIGVCSIPSKMTYERPLTQQERLELRLNEIFGEKVEIAKAVLKHESGLNLNAKGYNCRYNGVSKACKYNDRHLAWSVDCGLGQINVKGQKCPPELMTLEHNLNLIEQKYKEQGLNAWVSYKTGAYKKYL